MEGRVDYTTAKLAARLVGALATFGLVHGAWHGAWCWEQLAAELRRRGHQTVAMDLPAGDAAAGPREYAQAAAAPLADAAEPVILVGHSLGGLTIGGVSALRPVAFTVYLCALVPVAGKCWDETRIKEPPMDTGLGPEHLGMIEGGGTLINPGGAAQFLYNDCPPHLALAAAARLRPQTYGITQQAQLNFPMTPSIYISARNDRMVTPAWSRASVAKDLAHSQWLEIDGDHSPMLGRPSELAEILAAITV